MPLSISWAWKVLNFDMRVSNRDRSSSSCLSTASVSDRRADLSFSRAGTCNCRLLSSLSVELIFCRRSLTIIAWKKKKRNQRFINNYKRFYSLFFVFISSIFVYKSGFATTFDWSNLFYVLRDLITNYFSITNFKNDTQYLNWKSQYMIICIVANSSWH